MSQLSFVSLEYSTVEGFAWAERTEEKKTEKQERGSRNCYAELYVVLKKTRNKTRRLEVSNCTYLLLFYGNFIFFTLLEYY